MSPSRPKAKPVFDPGALDDALDDFWSGPKSGCATTQPAQRSAAPPSAAHEPPAPEEPSNPRANLATVAPPPSASAEPPTSAVPTSPAPGSFPRRLSAVAQETPGGAPKRVRPPEVLLSSEVYDELYRVQIAEKKIRRGLARTMGAIVLDAIEAHAARLATTWSTQQYTVGEGQLFERPSSTAVPRRRRHATTPRTVVLSGVTGSNSRRLDDLVQAWGAGTRSALVEQALRYQFDLLPEAN